MDIIKRKYIEKFGEEEFVKTSLKIISHKDGFMIVRCNLSCYTHLLEIVSSSNGMFTSLNTAGTLKSLNSRMDRIKKEFMGRDINVADQT